MKQRSEARLAITDVSNNDTASGSCIMARITRMALGVAFITSQAQAVGVKTHISNQC